MAKRRPDCRKLAVKGFFDVSLQEEEDSSCVARRHRSSNAQGNLTLRSLAKAHNVKENHINNMWTKEPKTDMCLSSTCGLAHQPISIKKR